MLDSFIVVSHPYQQMALAGVGFVVIVIGSLRLYDLWSAYIISSRHVEDFPSSSTWRQKAHSPGHPPSESRQ